MSITVDLLGVDTGNGTLSDPYLVLYNSSGQLLAQNDNSGTGFNSQLTYTPSLGGTYYLDAGAYGDLYSGTYRLNVAAASTAAGSISISDVSVTEGNVGTQVATFTVVRTGGTGVFAVNFATANGTATAGTDYVATSGTLNFAAGETTRTISVTISGDITIEPSETFFVNLANATNGAIIADGQGQGTIVNNDGVGDDYADSFFDFSAPFGQVNAGSTLTGNLETIRRPRLDSCFVGCGQLVHDRSGGSGYRWRNPA